MNNYYEQITTFAFPTTIRFGKGVISELALHLKEKKLKNPLIVTDPGLAKLDLIARIKETLSTNKISASVFSNIDKNPVKSNVIQGVEQYLAEKCDCIVGIGGGASMDVARAVALKVNHEQDLFDYVELVGGDKLITEEIPYFITVPTTSGTGSEVGRSTVISDDKTHQKHIIYHPGLLAKIVFADPELTMQLPPAITAATGMDALTHNIEAFLSRGFHPLCDGIALEGIRLIDQALEKATTQPDLASRSRMMAAALMGAVAFQKGLGLVHSMAHALSTHKDLHHGLANALMLPAGIRFNRERVGYKVTQIEKHLNLNQGLDEYIVKLAKNLNLPANLSSQGIKNDDIDVLAKLALADGCHQCNEFSVTENDFKRLFKEALH